LGNKPGQSAGVGENGIDVHPLALMPCFTFKILNP
jgi:hypothetical protein